jgi:hypothetical protein
MTLPLILGFGMTIAYWILYRLRPRRWRKWGGVLFTAVGGWALFETSGMNAELSLALAITSYTGLWLFEKRDLFSEGEA